MKRLVTLITFISLMLMTGAEARGWAWFVANIKTGPHCNGSPTTYYGEGRRNADGSVFDPNGNSAASWHYPFGTVLRVTNCSNGKSTTVVVKDRGPGKHQRALGIQLDLSRGAAREIALGQNGRFESGYTVHSVVSMGDGVTMSAHRSKHHRRHQRQLRRAHRPHH